MKSVWSYHPPSHCHVVYTAVQLCGLSWNPSPDFPNLVAVIVSSGKLQLLDVKDDVKVVDSKPGVAANASEYDR